MTEAQYKAILADHAITAERREALRAEWNALYAGNHSIVPILLTKEDEKAIGNMPIKHVSIEEICQQYGIPRHVIEGIS